MRTVFSRAGTSGTQLLSASISLGVFLRILLLSFRHPELYAECLAYSFDLPLASPYSCFLSTSGLSDLIANHLIPSTFLIQRRKILLVLLICLGRVFILSFLTDCQPANGLAADIELPPLSNQLHLWGKRPLVQSWGCTLDMGWWWGSLSSPWIMGQHIDLARLNFPSLRRARYRPQTDNRSVCLKTKWTRGRASISLWKPNQEIKLLTHFIHRQSYEFSQKSSFGYINKS